ncbi:TCF3 fusion partner isoform X3 [Neophocaena asiaeorientalis asiaeorientalis]|uniref:TCF3 fusion partner isoform X3 n=1 Tax=Neophocaena asiaeorientalis asiaeorientalis TaxID=1706337 RepID=A0A341B8J3_NEOAA|nr:TCF3 fusion partner isoform X3 [Neophocaena asiaeorientalis asiaeorientalis]
MELEQREGTMAAVGFEEFSAPPGSELALPPLFGGHILESELETEVEFVSGGLGGSGLRERDEEEEAARGRRRRQRELNRRKYQALGRRCREIEQVGERAGPEQAPSGTEDNSETPAGAEVTPCTPAPGLHRLPLLPNPCHHHLGPWKKAEPWALGERCAPFVGSVAEGRRPDLGSQTQLRVPFCCVTQGKPHPLSEPQFPIDSGLTLRTQGC